MKNLHMWKSSFLMLLCLALFVQQTGVHTEQHQDDTSEPQVKGENYYNPCCWFPCKNGGICMQKGETYECDCTGSNYYGTNCTKPTWTQFFKNILLPSPETRSALPGRYKWFWKAITSVPFLYRKVIKYIYLSRGLRVAAPAMYTNQQGYITLDSYYNASYYARELPPMPDNCPRELGFTGPKKLPPVDVVYERLLKRKYFKPDPLGTNLLFVTYAQHFTHQFFKTDYVRGLGLTFGTNEGVDVSQIYGQDEHTRRALRSGQDGKLKTEIINGEEFPPYLHNAPGVDMFYPTVPET